MRVSRLAGAVFPTSCAITRRKGCVVTHGFRNWLDVRCAGRHMRNEMASFAETTKIHFRVLDSWRGIAALLVALFHLNLYSAIYPLDFVRNAYLFVDFFFVLSGFVITYSYGDRLKPPGDLGAFALRRFGRLRRNQVRVLKEYVTAEAERAEKKAQG